MCANDRRDNVGQRLGIFGPGLAGQPQWQRYQEAKRESVDDAGVGPTNKHEF